MRRPTSALLSFFLATTPSLCAQSAPAPESPAQSGHPAAAASQQNPPPGALHGLIEIDAVVADPSQKLVTGLHAGDFKILDNGERRPIRSFQAFNPTTARPDPPVQVILLVDTLNLEFKLALHEGEEVQRFLRQNGGHLAHPVSIFELSNAGLSSVADPSTDGNRLAGEFERFKPQTSLTRISTMRGDLFASVTFGLPPALTALKALARIATTEREKPGRKLLIWVGPGWGKGTGAPPIFVPLSHEEIFNDIAAFSTLLREARITLFTLSEGEQLAKDGTYQSAFFYEQSLGAVMSPKDATIDDLDRRVLAVQSGGQVFDPHKNIATSLGYNGNSASLGETASRATPITHQIVDFDLVTPINRSVAEADSFYTLSFDPARIENAQFHDLTVVVDKPGFTVRTRTGYYDQPDFFDRSNPVARPVTVSELQQQLDAARGQRDADVARDLSSLQLTQQLSDDSEAAMLRNLKGAKSRAALAALTEASKFLDPPLDDIPSQAPPDRAAQLHMLALTSEYLNKTMNTLPNLFATRTTVRYMETPEQQSANHHSIAYEPLHQVGVSKDTVLYRNGAEIAEAARKEKHPAPQDRIPGLNTEGTFGSILGAARDAAAVPGALTWSHWEKGANGLRAVFRYAIPERSSRFQVSYCCLPYGDSANRFQMLTGYHGEIAIDPKTGAILRLTLISDLNPDIRPGEQAASAPAEVGGLPLRRSDVLVEYGPVAIGGRTYICPIRSISISRSRTIRVWDAGNGGLAGSFKIFGPFATFMNDVSFTQYHVFRGEPRILPGYSVDPNSARQ